MQLLVWLGLYLCIQVASLNALSAASDRWNSEEDANDSPSAKDRRLSLLYDLLLRTLNEDKRQQCGVASTVSASDQDLIVNMHNTERGYSTSGAAAMFKMVWDDALARRAQELADTCNFEHDLKTLCDGTSIGQNLAAGTGSLGTVTSMVNGWINEKNHYDVGSNTCATDEVCGHYTAMVWESSYKVGCGLQTCSSLTQNGTVIMTNGNYLVCDYEPVGNWILQVPFVTGGQCSQCSRLFGEYDHAKCEGDGFCAACTAGESGCACVNVKSCQNGGTFDDTSCTCQCVDGYDGDNCEVDTSTISDKSPYCDQWLELCHNPLYEAFMTENCQQTCGL